MYTLKENDTLGSVASSSNTLTLTAFGQVLDAASGISGSTTENYQIIYQLQLTLPATTDYTVPAGKTVNIKSICVVNTDLVDTETFQLFANGTTQSKAITNVIKVPPGGMAIYEDGLGWQLFNSSGQLLTSVFASTQQKIPNHRITGHLAESLDRMLSAEVSTNILVSGTLFMQGIYLLAGMVINNIWFSSAITAAGTPTNQIAGLYDINRALLVQSNNLTTAAWAANTLKQFALQSAYTVPADGLYYCGLLVTATTVPTMKCGVTKSGNQLTAQVPILNGSSNTGLTTTLPNPANAITATTSPCWVSVS